MGAGYGLLGPRKSLSPPDQFSLVFQGTRFREVLGKAEECSTGTLGKGQEGPTASQGFHCVSSALAAPDSGPVSGELPQEQKRREGKGEVGDRLAGSEPGRGGGGGSNAKS